MSYESISAARDKIIADYHKLVLESKQHSKSKDEAVEAIHQLGFSRSDAEKWLTIKPNKR